MNSQDIHQFGLSVVKIPDGNPSMDIIFVHGFTGHPERTWAHRKGELLQDDDETLSQPSSAPGPSQAAGQADQPASKLLKRSQPQDEGEHSQPQRPSKTQRLGHKFLPRGSKRTDPEANAPPSRRIYWPRDLLPKDFPSARVLTYGYDTNIRHRMGIPLNRNTVCDIAEDFLLALEGNRRSDPARPLLFVVHSLGGIVVKQMLCRSHRSPHTDLRSVANATRGIVFFGTPHGGADPRSILHRVAVGAIKAIGFQVNEAIVDHLLPSCERLRELKNEFNPLAEERQWLIHSFQESRGVEALWGKLVVEDNSSYIGIPSIETKGHINNNHMDMCRFSGRNDPEYQKVSDAMRRVSTNCHQAPPPSSHSHLNDEQRKQFAESLRFDQIDSRRNTIKAAHAKTCKWLATKDEYKAWLDPAKLSGHHGFLWIKGKPGTGKSTLMKYALSRARKTMTGWTILEFFFNARGDELEKSTAGMYRSLLLQLLLSFPDLHSVFDSLPITSRPRRDGSYEWSIETLQELIGQAVEMLGNRKVVCFVDALDECDDEQVRDMIAFFETIGEAVGSGAVSFQVCFSSRHYPNINIRHRSQFTLEGQEGHCQDIRNYIDHMLNIGKSQSAQGIREELFDKAQGIFMWVVLVVNILNNEFSRGRIDRLRKRLEEIPAGLHELLRDILTRDSKDQDSLIMCIQWVLFAKRPLTPAEVYFAILSGTDAVPIEPRDPEFATMEAIQSFILDCSKGLAETTKSKRPVVQFIHESVHDFLLKEKGLQDLWPNLGDSFAGTSHDRLTRCCMRYVNSSLHQALDIPERLPASKDELEALRTRASAAYPFLHYAVQNILYHSDRAESFAKSQQQFVHDFPTRQWVVLDNMLGKFKARHHKLEVDLFYILAEQGLSSLIASHFSAADPFQESGERYGPPFFAALVVGGRDTVQAISQEVVQHGMDLRDPLFVLCHHYLHNPNQVPALNRDFDYKRRPLVLEVVRCGGDDALLQYLCGQEPTYMDKNGRGLAHLASQRGLERVLRILCSVDGIDLEQHDESGRSPLLWAIEMGNDECVRTLVEIGNVNSILGGAHPHRSAKYWDEGDGFLRGAASSGSLHTLRLLLAMGKFDPDSRDNQGQTPLSWAAEHGRVEVIQALLATGKVDPDSRDDWGHTPLSWAAEHGRVEVIQALLATGKVDPNSRDNDGRTSLSWAVENRRVEAIQALLATGKINPDSRDNLGRTSLSWAAEHGRVEAIQALLATGKVDPDSRDNLGRTSLSWAAENGRVEAIQALLATGKVDPDSRDNERRTSLSWAAEYGRVEAIQALLATGKVDPDSRDNMGWTPLDKATEISRRHHKHEAADLLVAAGRLVQWVPMGTHRLPTDFMGLPI